MRVYSRSCNQQGPSAPNIFFDLLKMEVKLLGGKFLRKWFHKEDEMVLILITSLASDKYGAKRLFSKRLADVMFYKKPVLLNKSKEIWV